VDELLAAACSTCLIWGCSWQQEHTVLRKCNCVSPSVTCGAEPDSPPPEDRSAGHTPPADGVDGTGVSRASGRQGHRIRGDDGLVRCGDRLSFGTFPGQAYCHQRYVNRSLATFSRT
jgi:hypothetical protein